MASKLEFELRNRLGEYLLGRSSLGEFEDSLVPMLWDVDYQSDAGVAHMAGEVHVLISEFARGDRSLQELRDELHKLVEFQIVTPESWVETGTSTQINLEPELVSS